MSKQIVAVFWEDHVYVDRDRIPRDPDEMVMTTLSVGVLYKETEKSIVLVNCIEAYEDRDDASYTVILKSTIQGIKEFGEIDIADLRE